MQLTKFQYADADQAIQLKDGNPNLRILRMTRPAGGKSKSAAFMENLQASRSSLQSLHVEGGMGHRAVQVLAPFCSIKNWLDQYRIYKNKGKWARHTGSHGKSDTLVSFHISESIFEYNEGLLVGVSEEEEETFSQVFLCCLNIELGK